MKVHEIMTGHPRSVATDTTWVEAAGLMRELEVGALPVCEGDELLGIVTDRDIVVRGIADGRDPAQGRVGQVMSGGVEAVSADDEVENAVRIMEQRQIRRLPVLDRVKRLVGIVSLGDVSIASNPAFGGTALRDVSEPNEPTARRRRLERESATADRPRLSERRRGPVSQGRATGARAGRGLRATSESRSQRARAKRGNAGARSSRSRSAPRSRR